MCEWCDSRSDTSSHARVGIRVTFTLGDSDYGQSKSGATFESSTRPIAPGSGSDDCSRMLSDNNWHKADMLDQMTVNTVAGAYWTIDVFKRLDGRQRKILLSMAQKMAQENVDRH